MNSDYADRARALARHAIALANKVHETPAERRDLAIAQLEIAVRALSDAAENMEEE